MTSAPGGKIAEEFGRLFRGVTGQLASGVGVILVLVEGQPHATTVTSLTVASFTPPLMAVFVARGSRTERYLVVGSRFTVNALAAEDHVLAARLARPGRRSGWGGFAVGELVRREQGPPLLAEAIAWLDCEVERVTPVGDHSLIVGSVLTMGRHPEAEPLIYYRGRFHRLGQVIGPGRQVAPDEADLQSSW